MLFTEKLYLGAKETWDQYLEQPFLKELAQGTLKEEAFRFYMVQDYLYLLQYAKIFALGVVKAHDEVLMRRFANMVHDTLDGEMNLHKDYMTRLGITKEEVAHTKTAFANQSYTSYMLDVSQRGDILDVLVAVLSCAWSYEMIGVEISKVEGTLTHPFYGEWVEGYSSEGYHQSVEEIKELVNEMAVGLSPTREDYLTQVYVNCCKYERDFWDMAYALDLG